MTEFEFLVNNKVDIIYNDKVYKSDIQDIGPDFIAIRVLVSENEIITLNKNDQFEVLYYLEDEVYKFDGKVKDRRMENNIPQIQLEIPNKIERVQRREYFRIDVTKAIKFKKIEADEKMPLENIDISQGNEGFIIDLSGGGLKLRVCEDVKLDDILAIELKYDDDVLKLKGKVVRVEKDNDKKATCGLLYVDIDENTREKLIKLIFSIMRKHRKNI